MPEQRVLVRGNTVGFAAAVILALAIIANGLTSYSEFLEVRDSFRLAQHSEAMLNHLSGAMGALRDAETGERGFLLTGRREYLAPYYASIKTVHARLSGLVASATEQPQKKRVSALAVLAAAKLTELENTISVMQRSGLEPALAIVQTGEGNALMRRIRSLADQIESSERGRLARRSADAGRIIDHALLMTLLSTMAVAALLALTLVQFTMTGRAQRLAISRADSALEAEVAARREADSLSRAKDQFIATISHELRTPLTAILGWSQMLEDKTIERQFLDEGLHAIRVCAVAQKQLIEDLLDLSRIVAGKMRLEMRTISLGEAARVGVDTVRPAADAKSIHLDLDIEENLNINADPDRIQQVVWNLVSNAVKFTPRGGTVRVIVCRNDSHAVIEVSDSGEGIDSEFLPHVFEPFRQADASKMRVHKGLGLGLAIVNQIVQIHGGTITVTSEGRGKGATFRVAIPIMPLIADLEYEADPAFSAQREQETPRSTPASPEALRGLSILVVDDHAPTLDLVCHVLRRSGAEVHGAANPAAAMTVATNTTIDFIVSDIGLPGESGVSLLQRIRIASGHYKPAVALTAYAREEDRRRSLEGGFQAFLAKPVEPATLVDTIVQIAARS